MRSFHRFRGTAEEFICLQQACCPLFFTLSDEQRIRFAINEIGPCLSRNFWNGPSIIRTILNGVLFTTSKFEVTGFTLSNFEAPNTGSFVGSTHFLTLPHGVAYCMGCTKIDSNWPYNTIKDRAMEHTVYRDWYIIFREMLENGLYIHQTINGLTLLHAFLEGCFQSSKPLEGLLTQKCNEALRALLQDLQEDANVDLKEFGEKEELIMKEKGCHIDFETFGRSRRFVIRLIGFSHGPSPEDWFMWISEPSDEFVGDFWAMIDRRMEMPGGWSEDVPLLF
jgi:hypothetical protein